MSETAPLWSHSGGATVLCGHRCTDREPPRRTVPRMDSATRLARTSAVAALTAVALASLVWRRGTPLPGTAWVTSALAAVLGEPLSRAAVQLGEPRTVAAAGVAVVAYGALSRRTELLVTAAGGAAALVATQCVAKPVVGHLRDGVPVFPSGHAAGAMVCAVMLAAAARPWPAPARRAVRGVCAAWAVLGSAGPVALGAHYPVDPLGSAAFVTAGVCGALAVHRFATHRRGTPAPRPFALTARGGDTAEPR